MKRCMARMWKSMTGLLLIDVNSIGMTTTIKSRRLIALYIWLLIIISQTVNTETRPGSGIASADFQPDKVRSPQTPKYSEWLHRKWKKNCAQKLNLITSRSLALFLSLSKWVIREMRPHYTLHPLFPALHLIIFSLRSSLKSCQMPTNVGIHQMIKPESRNIVLISAWFSLFFVSKNNDVVIDEQLSLFMEIEPGQHLHECHSDVFNNQWFPLYDPLVIKLRRLVAEKFVVQWSWIDPLSLFYSEFEVGLLLFTVYHFTKKCKRV